MIIFIGRLQKKGLTAKLKLAQPMQVSTWLSSVSFHLQLLFWLQNFGCDPSKIMIDITYKVLRRNLRAARMI